MSLPVESKRTSIDHEPLGTRVASRHWVKDPSSIAWSSVSRVEYRCRRMSSAAPFTDVLPMKYRPSRSEQPISNTREGAGQLLSTEPFVAATASVASITERAAIPGRRDLCSVSAATSDPISSHPAIDAHRERTYRAVPRLLAVASLGPNAPNEARALAT
jgi:hypothetical protein